MSCNEFLRRCVKDKNFAEEFNLDFKEPTLRELEMLKLSMTMQTEQVAVIENAMNRIKGVSQPQSDVD